MMANPEDVKGKFYMNNDLDHGIFATSRSSRLILLCDLNARVDINHNTRDRVVGPEGVRKCNRDGLLLPRRCAEHDLITLHGFPST